MNRAKKGWLLFPFLLLSACAAVTNTWIPLNLTKIQTDIKAKTLSTVYIRTYGQARYMNIGVALFQQFSSALIGEYSRQTNSPFYRNNEISKLSTSITDLAETIHEATERKNSNELEKTLDDYSLFLFFLKSFDAAKSSIKHFDLVVNMDSPEHQKIIERLCTYKNEKLDSSYTQKLNSEGNRYVSAFQFQYGIGARAGKEQLALTKKYRPFVRIVGLIKDVNTNEFVWGNKIIVFSDTVFLGVKEAKNASREALIAAFEIITNKLISIVINDINGERYTSEDVLVGHNPSIDDLL